MKYFLDTNLIIDFLNKKPEAMTTITRLAQDESSEIFVNRLVYLEALRTIPITDKRIFRGYSLKAGLRSRWLSGVEAGGGIRFDSAQRTTPKLSQLKREAYFGKQRPFLKCLCV